MTLDIISDFVPKGTPPIEYLNEVNSTVFRLNGKVLLRNNRNLSEDEFMVAREVCNQVNSFVAERDSYVQENRLSPLFCYGDANWSKDAKNDYIETFRKVVECRYEVINRLRLFTQFFTGYSIRHARFGRGLSSFEPLTQNTDSEIATAIKRLDWWVARWVMLASSVPDDYVFSPPRFLGEVGWAVSGVVVNHDTCVYQEGVNLLYESGVFDWLRKRLSQKGALRILEIGGDTAH